MSKAISVNEFLELGSKIKCLIPHRLGFEVENFILEYHISGILIWKEKRHSSAYDMFYLIPSTTEYVLNNISEKSANELLYILDLIS